jgi:hypothetical protein
LLATVAAVAAIGAIYALTLGRSPAARLFGGGANMRIVREATRVEAYRLTPPEGVDPFLVNTSPLEYRTSAGPVAVKSKLAERLQATLLSPQTYMWDAAKACGYPVYGVKLSFFRDGERVDVYFCFKCMVLRVVRDDQLLGGADFDHGKQVFVDTVKELFPQDAEIQAIRE